MNDPLYSNNIQSFVLCVHQVVQKKDSHDYRCLFRVCFIPRDPMDFLQEDPSAFEYLFQQVSLVFSSLFAILRQWQD